MVGLVIVALVLVFALIAVAYGVDSRDDSPDPRRSDYPIGLR